jgi:multidrug resistance efflux pump
MLFGLLVTFLFILVVWLVFFRFKWLKFSFAWAIVCGLFGAHLLLIFVIGLRFVTPYSTNAKVIQHTIQLIPRLPEPTLLTEVLVKPETPVKKGQTLFQFDRRPYQYKVNQLEAELAAANGRVAADKSNVRSLQAQLAAARQDVLMYKADAQAAAEKVSKAQSELDFAGQQYARYQSLEKQSAGSTEELQKWSAQSRAGEASVKVASAEADRARLKYTSQIKGVNTVVATATAQLQAGQAGLQQAIAAVANVKAQLEQARYYLDNTTMVAPEDGYMINLQAQPGMVAGILRVGGIASFIVDSDRYVLASFYQEHLKYVKIGQPVDVALDLFPGQVFKARVGAIWWASGEGQYLPTDVLPTFGPAPANVPQGQFAVKIYLDNPSQVQLPIGAQGAAAIYTHMGAWMFLRKIDIRMRSWFNWLYPLSGP